MSSSSARELTTHQVVTDRPRGDQAQQHEVHGAPAFDPTWLPAFGDRSGDVVRDRRHHGRGDAR
jgi:hypothetical protein